MALFLFLALGGAGMFGLATTFKAIDDRRATTSLAGVIFCALCLVSAALVFRYGGVVAWPKL